MESASASAFGFGQAEKNILVVIYSDDIRKALQDVPFNDIFKSFTACFDSSERKKVETAAKSKGDEAGKDEIIRFCSKAHDPRVFAQLCEAIGNYDPDLANKLACSGIHDPKHYQEILSAYYAICLCGGDVDFLSNLASACSLNECIDVVVYHEMVEILKQCASGASSEADASIRVLAMFLQHLPRHNPIWYWMFMQVLASIPRGLGLRDVLNKDFDEDLERYEYEKIATEPGKPAEKFSAFLSGSEGSGGLGFSDSDQPNVIEASQRLEEILMKREQAIDTDAMATSNTDSGTDTMTGSNSAASLTETTFQLRKYQMDLAEAAIRGENAVICAPTGSGKTYVAAEIIKRHFAIGNGRGKKPKVAFLVPTTQLVDQQFDVVKAYLGQTQKDVRIKRMKGGSTSSTTEPKAEGAALNDVIVTTPRVLLNIFKDATTTTPISLFSFTLVVLDECHHTDNEHPYNEIMNQYLDIRHGKPTDAPNLPQVVCLTASLGVGKADDDAKALQHVVHMLANMDAQALSTVTDENRAELAEFVNVPVDKVVRVPNTPSPLAISIEGIMAKIEKLIEMDFKLLKPELDALFKKGVSGGALNLPVTVETPARRTSPAYECWIGTWLSKFPKLSENATKPAITSAFQHLRAYRVTLDLNAHVPFEQALRYLTEKFDEFARIQSSDRDRQLVALYQQDLASKLLSNPSTYNVKNPLVESLTEILTKEFRDKPDARVLVFVRTRDLTMALEEFMNKDPRLKDFNAARCTGVQAAKDKGDNCQTNKEQQDLLERFRNGYYRILVATTVAEEGVDVEKCHLVIKYNHVTNEIAMVQRRGRGRAAGSESILLYKDDWIEEKEATNALREFLMLKAVRQIRHLGNDWLRRVIQADQMKEYKDRCLKRSLDQYSRQRLAGKTYDMLCKKCDKLLCSTSNMRAADPHYVAVDPRVWNRLYVEPNNEPRLFDTMVQAGGVSCGGCRNPCGIILRIKNTYLPALKISECSLRDVILPTGARVVTKKWKQALNYFSVDPMADSDLREMAEALNPGHRNVLDIFILRAQATVGSVTGNGGGQQ